MVAVESLTHGLAIVGSRIGGLADVACDSGEQANARLFELQEGAEGFSAALKFFLINPEALREARQASLAMATRFDLKHTLDQYEQLLKLSAAR